MATLSQLSYTPEFVAAAVTCGLLTKVRAALGLGSPACLALWPETSLHQAVEGAA